MSLKEQFYALVDQIREVDGGEWYDQLEREADLSKDDRRLLLRIKIMSNFVQQAETVKLSQPEITSFESAYRTARRIIKKKQNKEVI